MNMTTVMQSLELMGKGMLGIFIVMACISLLVYGLGKLGEATEKKK